MLKIYNTLSHKVEEFKPINPGNVGMYSCGPTVYDYQHIGHMRRYVGDDILVRTLKSNGYDVKHVMNITDVGHLVSDADEGEDKMEKGAKKFGMSVWDIAKKFEKQFFDSMQLLHIKKADVIIRATDAIDDQIELIKILEEKDYTYKTSDGIYFDTSKFPDYFKLSRQNPEELRGGARVNLGEKKNITDFALWKFSPSTTLPAGRQGSGLPRRQMEWESPWGVGFPGWHIECSAMSMEELGPHFDIHTGGIDHIMIHHTNEIAQSEAASGKRFVNFWVHHNFLQVEGQKMSKSLGNIYTVEDIKAKGFDPFALRYLYLQTHYRQEMNFTLESLDAAQNALNRLRKEVQRLKGVEEQEDMKILRDKDTKKESIEFEGEFADAINDDLNTPKGLAIIWELVKSGLSAKEKLENIYTIDTVLGLELEALQKQEIKEEKIPEEVTELMKQRQEYRKDRRYHLADQIRRKIEKMGYELLDDDSRGTSTVRKVAS